MKIHEIGGEFALIDRLAQQLMQCCDGFIQKPFRLASLSTKVRELLGTTQNENP